MRRPGSPGFRPTLTAILSAALVLMSACAGADLGPDARADRPTDGPLSVSGGSGGAMILQRQPGSDNRRAVFGGLLLCTTGTPATLERVRFLPAGATASAGSALRLVPDAGSRPSPDRLHWAPVSAWRGDLFGARLRHLVPGDLVRGAEGFIVDHRCTAPDPDLPRVELLTTVATGPAGVSIDRLEIHYEAAGAEYTAVVPWSYTLCGEEGQYSGC